MEIVLLSKGNRRPNNTRKRVRKSIPDGAKRQSDRDSPEDEQGKSEDSFLEDSSFPQDEKEPNNSGVGGDADSNIVTSQLDNIQPDQKRSQKNNSAGTMSHPVGTGKHARTNIIWYIVSAIFVIFACIASAFIIMSMNGDDTKPVSDSIKDVWGSFSPVLTLALGYLFAKKGGKKKGKDKSNP